MRYILLAPVISILGCTTASKITGPDGTEHQLISCESIEGCYSKATEVCGKYKIINQTSEPYSVNGTVGSSKKILVKCEK